MKSYAPTTGRYSIRPRLGYAASLAAAAIGIPSVMVNDDPLPWRRFDRRFPRTRFLYGPFKDRPRSSRMTAQKRQRMARRITRRNRK